MTAQRGVPAVPGRGVIWRVSCIMPMVWGYVAQTKGRASCTRVWGYLGETRGACQTSVTLVPG